MAAAICPGLLETGLPRIGVEAARCSVNPGAMQDLICLNKHGHLGSQFLGLRASLRQAAAAATAALRQIAELL